MINRPISIPGRRKVITKNMILEAQKHTKDMSDEIEKTEKQLLQEDKKNVKDK